MQNPQPSRVICSQCLRPVRACICACIQQVDCKTEVVILQHPAEVKHIKGSARLLHLCLPGSSVMVGEQFSEEDLVSVLVQDDKRNVLLYPELGESPQFAVDKAEGKDVAIRLILLDASWRKSKQMLAQNSILQSLPRYVLREMPASRYLIRHAHAIDQLSTLEACTYALMQLESPAEKFAPLLQAFDAFNELQMQFGVNNLLRKKAVAQNC